MQMTETRSKDQPTLEELQKFVGGPIEIVYLPEAQMIVNEEGLLRRLEQNNMASRIAGKMIVGNVMILSGSAMLD